MKIQTRQKADILASSADPLEPSASYASDVRAVSGYAEIAVFGVADQPFSVQILESADPEGVSNFVQTATITAQASGAQWSICERRQPCGLFVKTILSNIGAEMTELEYQVLGLPLP